MPSTSSYRACSTGVRLLRCNQGFNSSNAPPNVIFLPIFLLARIAFRTRCRPPLSASAFATS